MAYGLDLRTRVIAAVDAGKRVDDVAITFQVSKRVIYEWLELRRETGSIAAKTGYQKGHSHKITDWAKFKEFANLHKHSSSPKMIVLWEKLTGVRVSDSVMLRALHKINFTSKKKLLI